MPINMFNIDMTEAAADFISCWNAAGKHIQNQTGDDQIRWLRAHPYPPFLEHLSFLLGSGHTPIHRFWNTSRSS